MTVLSWRQIQRPRAANRSAMLLCVRLGIKSSVTSHTDSPGKSPIPTLLHHLLPMQLTLNADNLWRPRIRRAGAPLVYVAWRKLNCGEILEQAFENCKNLISLHSGEQSSLLYLFIANKAVTPSTICSVPSNLYHSKSARWRIRTLFSTWLEGSSNSSRILQSVLF